MTGTLAIITQGLRESNLIAISAEPTEAQQTEGLSKLQSLVASVFGYEVGEGLIDWPIGSVPAEIAGSWTAADWSEPAQNVRLLYSATSAQTITLPPTPDNGARIQLVDLSGALSANPLTIQGNGRRIENQNSVTLDTDNLSRTWFYRADLGNWMRLDELTLESEMPFPVQYDPYFETMLAMRLNPRYGRSADEQTVATLRRALGQLQADYRQRRNVRVDPALTRMSIMGVHGTSDAAPRRTLSWMR